MTFGSESLGCSRPARLSDDGFSGAEGVLTIVAMGVKAPKSARGASPRYVARKLGKSPGFR